MVSAKFTTLAGLVAAASMVAAAPAAMKKRDAALDTVILQYALTLEHLEDAFYRESLQKLDAKAFADAGYGPWVRQRFQQIGGHEADHVKFLTKALGDQAVKACSYNFGVTDVQSFVATSQLLEGVGVSAYLGAANKITNKDYITAAGSILTTEARHSAWVQSTAALSDPAGSAYDVPTSFNQTWSLAAPLITSCPKSNAALPVTAFPALTVSPSKGLKPGTKVKLSGKGVQDGQYLAVLSGAGTQYSQIQNGHATIPNEISAGRLYLLVTNKQEVSDDSTVAGPFPYDRLLSASKAASLASKKHN